MSVHKRNQKVSKYKKILQSANIQKILTQMYKKSDLYFPKGYEHYYFSLSSLTDEITKIATYIQTKEKRVKTDKSFIKCMSLCEEIIEHSEGCLQLSQRCYLDMKLYRSYLSKNENKVKNRFEELMRKYIQISDYYASFRKSFLNKIKDKQMINQFYE